ncbi:B12-binding domain-containing radical SAM protein [Paenibacillus tepidiphilus]|uniref:B12-binding domain-containing radical SAM protein n=1 Tax=Paenibacillus tepidiphilus TaxID=2608683 RepID=UPI00123C78DA|nr:radical SAM protein [Paenibacillus tepidiphilus]
MDKENFKISLIATTQVNLGIKAISGALLADGFLPDVLFLDIVDKYYPQRIIDQVMEVVRQSSIIGISTVEIGFERAKQLISVIKTESPETVVLIGGIYAILNPDNCIEVADIVCIGEGEQTVVDLANKLADGDDYSQIPNLWIRHADGSIQRNDRAALVHDLDALPYSDHFSQTRHYYINELELKTSDQLIQPERATLKYSYNFYIMLSRGCHLACSYCSAPALKSALKGTGRFLRHRSIASAMDELQHVIRTVPRIDFIYFFDDDFCLRSEEDIEAFSREYKEKINIPFFCYGTPKTVTYTKIKNLLSAGLDKFVFGIQSGSDRILKEVYNRREFQEHVFKAADSLSRAIDDHYRETGNRLIPTFDIIYNNPWEQKEDLIASIEAVMRLHDYFKEFILFTMPLNIFRSTPLYAKAIRDGVITEQTSDSERKVDISYQQAVENLRRDSKHLYLNSIMYLMRYDHTEQKAGFLPVNFVRNWLMSSKNIERAEKWDSNRAFRGLIIFVLYILPTRDRKFFLKLRFKNVLASHESNKKVRSIQVNDR